MNEHRDCPPDDGTLSRPDRHRGSLLGHHPPTTVKSGQRYVDQSDNGRRLGGGVSLSGRHNAVLGLMPPPSPPQRPRRARPAAPPRARLPLRAGTRAAAPGAARPAAARGGHPLGANRRRRWVRDERHGTRPATLEEGEQLFGDLPHTPRAKRSRRRPAKEQNHPHGSADAGQRRSGGARVAPRRGRAAARRRGGNELKDKRPPNGKDAAGTSSRCSKCRSGRYPVARRA
jgi:hypothetical protein